MATSKEVSSSRSFEEIEPFCKWKRGQDSDVLEVHLPAGVRKEHLKVQINNLGSLTITGECPLNGNKGIRIRKETKVPRECNTSEVRAKFSKGVLRISMPKAKAPNQSNDQTRTGRETQEARRDSIKKPQDEKVALWKLKEYGNELKRLGKKTSVRVAVVAVVVAAAAAVWAYTTYE